MCENFSDIWPKVNEIFENNQNNEIRKKAKSFYKENQTQKKIFTLCNNFLKITSTVICF